MPRILQERRQIRRIAPATIDPSRPGALTDPKVTRIAVRNPKTVPAGQYTEESLRAMGLWDRLQPKMVFAENVRQVLEYVNRGQVDAGQARAAEFIDLLLAPEGRAVLAGSASSPHRPGRGRPAASHRRRHSADIVAHDRSTHTVFTSV